MSERPEQAKSWRVDPGVGLIVNEEVFPWYVVADPAMRVEPLGGIEEVDMHILWVPMLMEGPIPTPERGRPGGEELPDAAHLGDLCWCPVADGSGHYWHPTVCPSTPTPTPADHLTTTEGAGEVGL